MVYMTCILSQKEDDTSAQVLLDVAAFERVTIEDALEQTQLKVAYTKELLKLGIWSDGKPIVQDSTLLNLPHYVYLVRLIQYILFHISHFAQRTLST
jgi:hypothetical protein